MTGEKQIITIRKQGLKPVAVFIEAGLAKQPFDYEEAIDRGMYPVVHFKREELTVRHDLRFLAGLRVHVQCESITDDVLTLTERIAKAGAAHVVACGLDGELMEYKNKEWCAWKF